MLPLQVHSSPTHTEAWLLLLRSEAAMHGSGASSGLPPSYHSVVGSMNSELPTGNPFGSSSNGAGGASGFPNGNKMSHTLFADPMSADLMSNSWPTAVNGGGMTSSLPNANHPGMGYPGMGHHQGLSYQGFTYPGMSYPGMSHQPNVMRQSSGLDASPRGGSGGAQESASPVHHAGQSSGLLLS